MLEENKIRIIDKSPADPPAIEINEESSFQIMDGFGYTLTGGSTLHIHHMSQSKRKDLLQELFGRNPEDIGVSYLRVSIGASDLDEEPFSYDELPEGEVDLDMCEFSLAHDQDHLIPVLKEILAINLDIKILGSPWSPPRWMKDNKDSRGGSLLPEYYDAYVLYVVKYIEGMRVEGIPIDAITIQNEPLPSRK